MSHPITTTIHCKPWQYPLLLNMFMAQAEQRMVDVSAADISQIHTVVKNLQIQQTTMTAEVTR